MRNMDDLNSPSATIHLRIIHRWNSSASSSRVVTLYENSTGTLSDSDYDYQGALCYIVFVVIVYGICITMLIPSSAQINHHENAMQRYMSDIERARKLAWRQEKFKTRLIIHRQSWQRILGCDRAEIIVDDLSSMDIERRASCPALDSRRNSSIGSVDEEGVSDVSDTYKVENESRRSSVTIQTIDWSGDTYEIIAQHTVPLPPPSSTARNGRETFMAPSLVTMERRRTQFLNRTPLATLSEQGEGEGWQGNGI